MSSYAGILHTSQLMRSGLPRLVLATSYSVVCVAVIYLVDISECPDFNTMYELYDPCTVMFFFRNKVGVPLCIAPAVSVKVMGQLATSQ